jgi:hypothetical protein
MKKTLTVILLLITLMPVFAQVDTTYQGKAGVADVAEDDPGLLLFMMAIAIGWIGILFLSLLGVLVMAAIALGLTAAGIVTSSLLVGWYRKSVYSGVKWFVYVSFALAGALGGAIGSMLLRHFVDTGHPYGKWLGWGIPIGMIGGLLSAWVLIKISRYVYDRYIVKKAKGGNG